MFARIKAAVAAFVARADVQSVARHAATAGGAVIIAAVTVGGVHAITAGVAIAALAAAGRVIWLAVQARLQKAAAPSA